MIRVVVADDHAIVRRGVVRLLEAAAEIEPVGEAGTTREAEMVIAGLRPDVAVIDWQFSDGAALDLIPKLRRRVPNTRIVVLSMYSDPETVRQAMAVGARGYVPKEAADSELLAAIRQVAAGGSYLAPQLGAALAASLDPAEPAEPQLAPIDDRILRLVALGHTNREVAAELHLHPRNVERRRLDAMKLLGLRTRAELVRYAVNHGWLDD